MTLLEAIIGVITIALLVGVEGSRAKSLIAIAPSLRALVQASTCFAGFGAAMAPKDLNP